MSDMAEDFRALQELRQARHQNWKADNLAILAQAGIPCRATNHHECICFREAGKPKVDFYPSTGRWRVVGGVSETFSGGATAFLAWYRKQEMPK